MTAAERQVVLVTGGGSGIGLAYGRAFAEIGYRVVLADIRDDVEATARDLPGGPDAGHLGVRADVASEPDTNALAELISRECGRLNVLINNAAIVLGLPRPFKPFEETSWEEWRRVFDVNVGGVFLVTRAMLQLLRASSPACVINIGSDAVWKGYDGQLAYFASKGSIRTMTRCLARELGPHGIRVNCIAPGYTLSESVLANETMRRVRSLVQEASVLNWDQHPDAVAQAAIYLAGPGAHCVSGQTLVVNRGAVMP
jgi:NAD(P)-dependent dehydrogenase (short-subunit alcohol dehydrogenase family)